jgi:hypothetical protein
VLGDRCHNVLDTVHHHEALTHFVPCCVLGAAGCRLPAGGTRAMGTSGEEVEVRQTPDLDTLRRDLQVSSI